ncbi:hypothetical protein BpHYR1_048248 [Brachionus plicatilis]|uniref:Uncharacterized protein n=1 Tax=Brachionus plicatilis TaxID=10195 RepID=A0A3M7PB01_BRAPC|nr:hypothetical protein BpHYR1_048248 [Brachionus plicatilis]
MQFYLRFLIQSQPVPQNLVTALESYTQLHLDRPLPLELVPVNPKKFKSDKSGEIYFLEARSFTDFKRVPISLDLLKLDKNQELNNLHITELQNLIFKKYGPNGLFMPDYFSIEGPPFNPDVLDENIFIQVAHAKNHWVVISNYNPSEPACSNNCYICDSLNNPVSKQNGSIDCGLFGLGYALALAIDIVPANYFFQLIDIFLYNVASHMKLSFSIHYNSFLNPVYQYSIGLLLLVDCSKRLIIFL